MSFKRYQIQPDRKLVFKHLGYPADSAVPEGFRQEAELTLNSVERIMEPRVHYIEVPCKVLDAARVIFGEHHIINSQYVSGALQGCENVVVAVSTLGSGFDRVCSGYHQEKDYVSNLVADAAGVIALNTLNRVFWSELADLAAVREQGLTKKIAPGLGDWGVEDQWILFEILGETAADISLNDSFMMSPVRSETAVYGFGRGIGISKVHHDCWDCGLSNCRFRQKGQAFNAVEVVTAGKREVLPAAKGKNLFSLLVEKGVMVPHACGGNKTCGKCRVRILEGSPPSVSVEEKLTLSQQDLSRGIRLACCVDIHQDMVLSLKEEELRGRVLSTGVDLPVISQPKVRLITIPWASGSLTDQRDHAARILGILQMNYLKVSLAAVRSIPAVLSESGDFLGVIIHDGNEILGVSARPEEHLCYGIALDIGTTTLAAALVNQTSGTIVRTVTALNPQKQYGADVITRIQYASNTEDGLQHLQQAIVTAVNQLISRLCTDAGIRRDHIYEMTAAGNTTMLHLLLGVPCESIAAAPFIPGFTASVQLKAHSLGIRINPEGYFVTLPAVSAYIGGDTTGAILATRLFQSDSMALLLDIGTNGEIVLGSKNRMIACSAAAGPAFEGSGVRFGTGGIEGAIDHVKLSGECSYSTIGDKPPVGICGSGIIDVIAGLIRTGIVDSTGRFRGLEVQESDQVSRALMERITMVDGKPVFMIAPEQGIYLTQKDIREIQLAKSAIRSGIEILMGAAGIGYSDITTVFLAGGFGNYMDIQGAVTIGLIPEALGERCVLVGNAALSGAAMTLMNVEEADRMTLMHQEIEYIEMSGASLFEEAFIRNLGFGPELEG